MSYKVYKKAELEELSVRIVNFFGDLSALEEYWYSTSMTKIEQLSKERFNLSYYYFRKICIDIFKFKARTKEQIRDLKKETWHQHPHYSDDKKAEMNSKREQTCLEKYGEPNVSKVSEIKQKIAQSTFEHFGAYNVNSLDENKKYKSEKMKSRSIEEKANVQEKVKRTCLARYGETNPYKTKEVKEKIKLTKLERYNDENFNNREKAVNTSLAKYGCEYYHQFSIDYHFRKYKYDNAYFDSLPELAVYLYCTLNNIEIRRNTIRFKYSYMNKTHYCFPDFILNNTLVEIKGDYLFSKMLRPNTLDNAKYHCLIENGVEIWTSQKYNFYLNWFIKQGYKKEDFLNRKE